MQRPRPPYLDTRFAAMAHRGGWVVPGDRQRENSAYAFRRAVELGYRYLELDVHTTSDGVLVAFHDDMLDRVTDATGRIADHPWAELSGVRIGGTDPIPRLDDLLDELGESRFNIDIKQAGAIGPLAATIRARGAGDRVCVGSFSGARLAAFRKLAPDVLTSMPPRGVAVATHAIGLRRVLIDPGLALQIPVRQDGAPLPLVRPDVIRWAHAHGRVVHVWTVNDADEMRRLIDLGVDGLVSDDLSTLKEVLVERGLWEDR
ncbi:glycerophosphodiester phosphodiesterase [Propionicimonas sp.]|uniref:glycerophosphodiester phosphodiesterase n=1 Tax=Propionicimonas sp. TaxID=1955623 RepID=UPI0039E38FDD